MRHVPGPIDVSVGSSRDRGITCRHFEQAIDDVERLVFIEMLVKGHSFPGSILNEHPSAGATGVLGDVFEAKGVAGIPIPLVRRGFCRGVREDR